MRSKISLQKLTLIFIVIIFFNILAISESYSFSQDKNIVQLENKIRNIINKSKGTIALSFLDLNNQSRISINDNKSFIAASTIKVAVMLEVFKQIKSGYLNFSQIFILKDKDKLPGSGILKNRKTGTRVDLKKLVYLMIAKSDNTATKIIIDTVGMKNINKSLKALNLHKTILKEKTLFVKTPVNKANLITTQDMLLLYKLIFFSQVVDKYSCSLMLKILSLKSYGWGLPRFLPSKTIIAHKTGTLLRIRHDGGIVYTPKGNYILCILTQNIPSSESSKLISKLSFLIYTYYLA